MKKVLVISYYWPPSGGSGVQRWVKMCKYLPSLGWLPVVYTPENPALTSTDASLGADVPAEVEVIRRPILEPGQFARKSTNAQVTPINSQKKSLKQRIAMWIRGNCFIPDPRVLWVRPSVRFLEEYLKGHPVDAIVSTGPPHSMHLIAKKVAAATGIPWVADFRDPWTRMFYFKHLSLTARSQRRHAALEKSVLDSATRVVAVSPLVQKDFQGMTQTSVELITNGFDEDDFPVSAGADATGRTGVKPDATKGRFTLLHAGLFASDGNPEALWRALGSMVKEDKDFEENFHLVLCGKTDKEILDSIEHCGLSANVKNLGYLEHTKVVELMQAASVLLLPLRKEPEYKATLPGKLFEYLAARRPILGIGQKDGAMASILSEAKAGETFEWEEQQQMRRCLEEQYKLFKIGGDTRCSGDIEKYSRRAVALSYAHLLDSICGK
ncbi:MAG: glycosyltransferase family 4 protein [Bacteroidales bacterium]|nr:glycosyltransferase family 4 protein [Bacteroidales bacterium]